jgi:hypothetical protein
VTAVAWALLLAGSALRAGEILPLSKVVPGMKGWGLTVMKGSEIARFEVEVLGVIPGTAPGRSIILVRASGLGLENSGIVGGMSGSPVYLDGKLAGALSSGFAFEKEPVGGVTPIESMLAIESAAPAPAGRPVSAIRPSELLEALASAGELGFGTLERRFREMEALLPPDGTRLLAPSCRGIPSSTLLRSDRLLADLGVTEATASAPAGAGPVPPSVPPPPLAEGGSITALLVDGDFQLGATGTVTRVEGDGRFIAFGHPFLGMGELEIPVAPSNVITVVPSVYSSFKLGHPAGPASWRLTRDRDAGVAGRTDRSAAMVPVRFRFRSGTATRELAYRVAPHPRLLPLLLAISTDAALTTSDPTPRDRTLRFRVSLDTAAGTFAWEDLISGPRAKETAVLTTSVLAGLLADNEFTDPGITSVSIDAASEAGERRLRIVDAALVSRRVAPGSDVVVTVRLADRRGAERTEVLRVKVPSELPDGRASLVVGDGNVISGLRFSLEPGEPRSLDDLRRFVERIVPGDRLGAALVVPGRGAVTGPSTLTSLPPSAAALLGDGERGDGARHSLGSRIVGERLVVLDRPVAGSVRLEFEVERPRS